MAGIGRSPTVVPAWIWLKDPKLTEVAPNLSDEYADRTCCVVAVRGSLIRNDRAAASALTRAVLEAGHRVHESTVPEHVFDPTV